MKMNHIIKLFNHFIGCRKRIEIKFEKICDMLVQLIFFTNLLIYKNCQK